MKISIKVYDKKELEDTGILNVFEKTFMFPDICDVYESVAIMAEYFKNTSVRRWFGA